MDSERLLGGRIHQPLRMVRNQMQRSEQFHHAGFAKQWLIGYFDTKDRRLEVARDSQLEQQQYQSEWYLICLNSVIFSTHRSQAVTILCTHLSLDSFQGKIPTEIGLLSNLTYLRLSYNEFTGNGTNFGSLESLKLIHLHGNRLSGIIPTLPSEFSHSSSYVSDCGNPSDFNPSLRCDDCTMCCTFFRY